MTALIYQNYHSIFMQNQVSICVLSLMVGHYLPISVFGGQDQFIKQIKMIE